VRGAIVAAIFVGVILVVAARADRRHVRPQVSAAPLPSEIVEGLSGGSPMCWARGIWFKPRPDGKCYSADMER